MVSEWKPIGEMLSSIIDYRGRTPPKSESGIPCISAANVKNGQIDVSTTSYVSQDTYDTWTTRGFPKPGDVVITTEAPVGEIAPFPDDQTYLLTRRVMALQTNPELLDSRFLIYALQTPAIRDQLFAVARGTTVQRVLKTDITGLEIPTPPLPEQKAIAHILGSLDDKIELNRRMNATLEAMAQALFQSWFVDFDPVLDNALAAGNPIPEALAARADRRRQALADGTANREAAKAFPAAFEFDEELGWIPEGWETKELGSITTELRRGISPKYTDEGGVRVINQRCIRDHSINFSNARFNDTSKRKVDGRHLQTGDLLINSTGVGTLGRMAQVLALDELTVVDSHVTVVRSDPTNYMPYTFGRMMISIEPQVEAMGHGSTGQTELSRARLSVMTVIAPPLFVQEKAEALLSQWAAKLEKNSSQNHTLANLRDTLLPKLISGELRIPDAATLAEETLT